MVSTVEICHFYKAGYCRTGENCQYAHPAGLNEPKPSKSLHPRELYSSSRHSQSERFSKQQKANPNPAVYIVYRKSTSNQPEDHSSGVVGVFSTLKLANDACMIYQLNQGSLKGLEEDITGMGREEDGRLWVTFKGFEVRIERWIVDDKTVGERDSEKAERIVEVNWLKIEADMESERKIKGDEGNCKKQAGVEEGVEKDEAEKVIELKEERENSSSKKIEGEADEEREVGKDKKSKEQVKKTKKRAKRKDEDDDEFEIDFDVAAEEVEEEKVKKAKKRAKKKDESDEDFEIDFDALADEHIIW